MNHASPIEESAVPPHFTTEAPAPVPVRRLEVHDVAAVDRIDPLLKDGDRVPFWADGSAPLVVTVDGATVLTLHGADQGEPSTAHLVADVLALLVAEYGVDDDGATSNEWTDEGTQAMRAVLADAPSSVFDVYRGAAEARLMMAEAVGRAYSMPPASIEALTGRPFVARRALVRPGSRAEELTARTLARAEEQRIAAESAARARVEAHRPLTVAQRGLDGCAVRRDRLATAEPFHGARHLFSTETEAIFGFSRVPGLEVPTFSADGVRSLSDDEIVPIKAAPPAEMTASEAAFVRDVRERFGEYDTGPVTFIEPPTAETLAHARVLAKQYARTFLANCPPHLAHWQRTTVELICRGLQIDPVRTSLIIYEAADAEHAKQHIPPTRFAPPSAWGRIGDRVPLDNAWSSAPRPSADLHGLGGGFVGELAIAASMGGFISAGALLENAKVAGQKRRTK